MKKSQKIMLLGLLNTLNEALELIRKHIRGGDVHSAQGLLAECQDTAIQMGTIIEQWEGEGFVTVHLFEEYCEALFLVHEGIADGMTDAEAYGILRERINQAEDSVKRDIKVRVEVVFMPYKASMWDCLESIWKAADADRRCDAYVVPIPYYDRNPDGTLGQFHYEGGEFPEYVPIVPYEGYSLEKRRPDAIYIHNPYDQYNYVTSVDPRFYSKNLKTNTNLLVYIPYHITGYYGGFHTACRNIPAAFQYADFIVVPSVNQKEYFMSGGVAAEKLLVLGNPKTDFVVNELQYIQPPKEWEQMMINRKVFLLNSTVSRVLRDNNWGKSMLELVNMFEKSQGCFLIWRPHPLLKATLLSMRPQKFEEFESIVDRIKACRNVIMDVGPSAYPAMKVSDALISDYSSIMMQYCLTGKPSLLTEGTSEYRKTQLVCFDYFSNYFMNDGVTVNDFINMVCSGSDERREERMAAITRTVVNVDGSCGVKIHSYISDIALREKQ